MKRILIIFILLLAAVPVIKGQTSDNTEGAERAELQKLNKETLDLFLAKSYDAALSSAFKALPLSVKLNGAESKPVALIYFSVGALYKAKKQHSESLENFQKSLAIYQKKFPGDKARMLETIREIGLVYYKQDENRAALKWMLEALDLSVELTGEESKETVEYLSNIAILYRNMGDEEKAEPYLWRGKEASRKVFGADSPTYELYADIYSCFSMTANGKVKQQIQERWAALKRAEPPRPAGKVLNGRATHLSKPIYPATVDSIGGRVSVKVTINEEGQIISAKAFCGPTVFWRVSERAALESRFSPTLLDGKPVKVSGIIIYIFPAKPFRATF